MPDFTPDDLHIDPREYLSECSNYEIEKVIEWLYDKNKLNGSSNFPPPSDYLWMCSPKQKEEALEWLDGEFDMVNPKSADSLKGQMFGETLVKIFKKQFLLTPEEMEIIEKIGDRFV